MKVLLVNPPAEKEYIRVERCMQVKESWGSLWQPIQLCYAQSILNREGHETKLIDCIADNLNWKQLKSQLDQFNPYAVVVNTALPTLENDLKIINITKARIASVGIPGIISPKMMKNVDAIIQGDVEKSVLEFCDGKNGIIKNQVKNLDDLPFPDFDDLNLNKYTMPFSNKKMVLIVPSRGCPFKCSFCLVPLYHNKAIFRSPENIVDELERNVVNYNISDFLFWSETFTLKKDFVIDTCNEITMRNLKIEWMTPCRSDSVDEEILKSMKTAGCNMISYGVECLDQSVLDKIKKSETVKEIENSIKLTKKHGIKVIAHVVVGLPGETEEMFKSTINRLIQLNVDYVQVYAATPYPRTELHKIAKKNKWITEDDVSKYQINNSIMRNEFLSVDEIQKLRKWGMRKFYIRSRFVSRELFRHNPKNLFSAGMRFILEWSK